MRPNVGAVGAGMLRIVRPAMGRGSAAMGRGNAAMGGGGMRGGRGGGMQGGRVGGKVLGGNITDKKLDDGKEHTACVCTYVCMCLVPFRTPLICTK